MPRTEIVPILPHSDGDASHRPKAEWKLCNPPTIYLEKIGTLWMQSRGEAKEGWRYYLNRLPDGYALFERPRPNNPKQVDKHLYGHPQRGKPFDSPNRFFPHFEHLMINGSNVGCPCTLCAANGTGKLGPGIGSSTKVKAKGRPKSSASGSAQSRHVDDESTPDTIRQLIDKLEQHSHVDEEIEERFSMDWRAEKDILPRTLQDLAMQKSWLPRAGEIVLFVRHAEGEISLENETHEYKWYKGEGDNSAFGTHPRWEAGVVGQAAHETAKVQDILGETDKTQSIPYSGFRIEPLPNPNGKDKSLSRQYKYVPLHQIRPFVFWREFLKGIPEETWHPTIKNALTVMASMSLVCRFRFKGTWPSATILCRGIYIGSELICVGDAVRITPGKNATSSKISDVLQVESIKLKLTNLDKANGNDNDEGHPYNTAVQVCGKAYTLDETRAWNPTPVSRAQPGMEGYDDWFWLHDPSKTFQASFTRILGRCFEAEPMLLWFPSTNSGDAGSTLNRGLSGVRQARQFSSSHDKRILPGKSWFWGDSRAETLAIESLNNVDVSYHDHEREEVKLDEWHKAVKVLEKTASAEERASLNQMLLAERLAGASSGLVSRTEVMKAVAAAAAAEGTDPDATPAEESESTSPAATSIHDETNKSTSRKRSYSVLNSRDELDQDEANYSLEDWVKPVAMLGTPRGPKLVSTKATPAGEGSKSQSRSESPGAALAAFKKPKVVVTLND